MTEEKICKARTKSGRPCHNKPVEGSDYCHIHQPAAVKEKPAPPPEKEPAPRPPKKPAKEPPLREMRPAAAPGAPSLAEKAEERLRKIAADLEARISPFVLLEKARDALKEKATKSRSPFWNKAGKLAESDFMDPDFWRGIQEVVEQTAEMRWDFLVRRLKGDYETDPYGLDEEIVDLIMPIFQLLYHYYWRVKAAGFENVPGEGGALIVANHAGIIPWDGAMIDTAIWEGHPEPRRTRFLIGEWLSRLPFVSPMLAKWGSVPSDSRTGEKLLKEGNLIGVFPEGKEGLAKPYKERYRLAPFGKGDFVRMAIRARVPIIPTAVVGAEETNPVLARADGLGRPLGLPYFPVTPTFPWLGLLGMVPLPTRWMISFCEPIATDTFPPEAADDPATQKRVAGEVRNIIQEKIFDILRRRSSVFF